MKDLGLADVILGIKINRTSEGLVLSQSHYVDKILEKFNKDDSALARTPIDISRNLSKNRDIAYAVSKLSRFTSNPGVEHWKAIIRLLRYLRYTRDHGLHYTRYPAVIEGYSDANWISDMRCSNCVKYSKQTVIARSTMESEFIALDKCGEEAEWLHHFLEDVPGWEKTSASYMHTL
ncbi:secreted RxLR effector protein 161-like [Primulina tabacum]|uniref:secreted RxLR effector protein 161-like n=1 Tax=Primulina tabacum TaxID=48773 RepID=UPI003F5920AE